ncbi:hypothetical protein M378DRAFT_166227 [Amanita muscaria Koide BX008]|uniref:Secreted protein n=1 Tax=Amanita muscaria (strain Koide BX008) TaxID=946122 RepID=A0A0C2WYZ5_AMAMK|nr:hypothetical protein M378DRAFT_166227 [Amanita muscaria Koide BX008]
MMILASIFLFGPFGALSQGGCTKKLKTGSYTAQPPRVSIVACTQILVQGYLGTDFLLYGFMSCRLPSRMVAFVPSPIISLAPITNVPKWVICSLYVPRKQVQEETHNRSL